MRIVLILLILLSFNIVAEDKVKKEKDKKDKVEKNKIEIKSQQHGLNSLFLLDGSLVLVNRNDEKNAETYFKTYKVKRNKVFLLTQKIRLENEIKDLEERIKYGLDFPGASDGYKFKWMRKEDQEKLKTKKLTLAAVNSALKFIDIPALAAAPIVIYHISDLEKFLELLDNVNTVSEKALEAQKKLKDKKKSKVQMLSDRQVQEYKQAIRAALPVTQVLGKEEKTIKSNVDSEIETMQRVSISPLKFEQVQSPLKNPLKTAKQVFAENYLWTKVINHVVSYDLFVGSYKEKLRKEIQKSNLIQILKKYSKKDADIALNELFEIFMSKIQDQMIVIYNLKVKQYQSYLANVIPMLSRGLAKNLDPKKLKSAAKRLLILFESQLYSTALYNHSKQLGEYKNLLEFNYTLNNMNITQNQFHKLALLRISKLNPRSEFNKLSNIEIYIKILAVLKGCKDSTLDNYINAYMFVMGGLSKDIAISMLIVQAQQIRFKYKSASTLYGFKTEDKEFQVEKFLNDLGLGDVPATTGIETKQSFGLNISEKFPAPQKRQNDSIFNNMAFAIFSAMDALLSSNRKGRIKHPRGHVDKKHVGELVKTAYANNYAWNLFLNFPIPVKASATDWLQRTLEVLEHNKVKTDKNRAYSIDSFSFFNKEDSYDPGFAFFKLISDSNKFVREDEVTGFTYRANIEGQYLNIPIVAIRANKREFFEDWMTYEGSNDSYRFILIIGYGITIDPATLQQNCYFLVRDTALPNAINYKVPAKNILKNYVAVGVINQLDTYTDK